MFSEWQATPRLVSRCRSKASKLKSQYLSEYRGATSANGKLSARLRANFAAARLSRRLRARRSMSMLPLRRRPKLLRPHLLMWNGARRSWPPGKTLDPRTNKTERSAARGGRDQAVKAKEAAHAQSEADLAKRVAD